MNTVTINRGEAANIAFQLTDTGNSLAGKRISASFATGPGAAPVLRKASALPGSTAAVTISGQAPGLVTGFINMLAADYATLTAEQYYVTVWADSGIGDDRPMVDTDLNPLALLNISRTVAR
jgi:hypothetical protein